MTDVQADLGDFQSLAKYNNGFRYMLVAVDVLSRRVFARPVKSKKTEDMIEAFENIFQDMPFLPSKIFTDRGLEFESGRNAEEQKGNENNKRTMLAYFNEKGIDKQRTRGVDNKAAVAERKIQEIKQKLYKYFSEKNTTEWVSVLPKIINSINNSVCRVTGMKPNDINPKNAGEVWDRLYKEYLERARTPKYKVDDNLRISLAKPIFEKGYLPTFSDEIFRISTASKANPNYYTLVDYNKEPVLGRFYNEELVKTIEDEATTYRIEQIYKTRIKNGIKEIQVKFIGYPEKYWIKQ